MFGKTTARRAALALALAMLAGALAACGDSGDGGQATTAATTVARAATSAAGDAAQAGGDAETEASGAAGESAAADAGAGSGAGQGAEAAPAATSEAAPAGAAPAGGEEVTLKILYAGPGSLPDTQLVLDAFNEELAKYLPNTKADINIVLSTNYEEQLRLALAAGETVDVANLTSGEGNASNDLFAEARKGSMLPLDDLLTGLPELKALVSEGLWSRATVDGKIYMVPINTSSTDKFIGIKTQAELAFYPSGKGLNVVGLHDELALDNGRVRENAYKILSDYLANLLEVGEIRRGVSVETMKWLPQRGYYSLYDWAFVAEKEDLAGCTVLNYFEQPDVKMMYQYHHDWYAKGYVEKDILSVQDRRQYERKLDGNVLSMTTQFVDDLDHYSFLTDNIDSGNYGFPVKTIPWERDYFIVPPSNAMQGLFIPRTSQNPERALQYIYATNSRIELSQLLGSGIEGVHYERNEEGNITPYITDTTQARYYGASWNWSNQLLPDPKSVRGNDYIDYINEVQMGSHCVTTPVAGFRLDQEPIKSELSQFDAIRQEYELSLYSGALDNWEQLYAEMLDKMQAAGSGRILEEIQRQVDEYLASA
jgi:putative aldouronate transport system substrate-binding protein